MGWWPFGSRNRCPKSIVTVGCTPETVPSPVAAWCAEIGTRFGFVAESARYLESVEMWRMAWRPERVRVLLVAESHVAEEPGDVEVRLATGRPDLPDSFCRLVYCLGYGEPSVCRPRSPANNRGTPQYWRIFATLAAGSDVPGPRGLGPKIRTLEALRDRGIWLVDASVAGIYQAGSRRIPQRAYSELIRESYERFVLPGLAGERPEVTCVIGKCAYDALAGMPLIEPNRWMYQPNARGDQGLQHRRQLLDLARLIAQSS